MGYTHFDKVCGVNGVAIGAKGSEVDIDAGSVQQTIQTIWTDTAGESWYTAAPVKGNLVSGYLVCPVVTGTTGLVEVLHGTAGAALMTFAAAAATVGTILEGVTTGTVAVTAGELLKVTLTAADTSDNQVYQTVVLVFDRT